MTPHHIAVVNFTRLGDIIQSGPLLRALKLRWPGAKLTVIAFRAFADPARHLPMVDDVIEFDVDRLVSLLDERRGNLADAYVWSDEYFGAMLAAEYDVVVNLSHTRQSAAFCSRLNSGRTMGLIQTAEGRFSISGDWFAYLLSLMRHREYNPFNLVEIYQRLAGFREVSPKLEWQVTAGDRRDANQVLTERNVDRRKPYVILHPGASSPSRQWPAAKFAELAVGLYKRGFTPIVSGSVAEKSLAQMIVDQSGGVTVSMAGMTSVGVLAAAIQDAHCVISNDTGTVHIAAAVGTRVIGVYLGPAGAKDTAPYGNGHVVIEADMPCAPCGYHDSCACPACGENVNAHDVLALAVADPLHINELAQNMRGVRIYRTEVMESGEFRLHGLNNPQSGMQPKRLSGYRRFWDLLVAGERVSERSICPFDHSAREIVNPKLTEIVELRAIVETAAQSISNLLQLADKSCEDSMHLSSCVEKQQVWQNALRDCEERCPTVAPFIRFLLVKLSTVYCDNISDYLSGMISVIELGSRGLALLENRVPVETTRTFSYATS